MARSSSAGVPVSVDRFFELSLVGLVLSGYLAVLGSASLDAPTAILVGAGLALRVLMITGLLRFHIPLRAVAVLTLAYAGFYPVDSLFISRDFLRGTVHLVFFLAVLRILTARRTRDYVFVSVIAFLELIAAAILSSSLSFFPFLGLFLVFGVAALASAEIRRSMSQPRQLSRAGLRHIPRRLTALSASVALGVLVLTAGLFFLLPRTAEAALRHLVPQRLHVTGFSNELTLGEIGEIQKSRAAVMHVRFFDSKRPSGLKWRGAALSQFDGRRWYNPPEVGQPLRVTNGLLQVGKRPRTAGIRYEVQLNPTASDALFFAGKPVVLRVDSPVVIRTSTDSYRLPGGNIEGLHYGAYSALEDPASELPPQPLTQDERIVNLLLPPVDRRIFALAREAAGGHQTAAGRARAIETYLQSHYRYTTELPAEQSPDPLAQFLFMRRQGHCEYFASAMTVMLRAIYIPARVVTGFQSGIYNPVSGWLIVRASDAHSWVEAWLPHRGWTTFDPTPPDATAHTMPLWSYLGFYIDAAETFWQEWVLNYNLDRQLLLAARMEDSSLTLGSRWIDRVGTSAARIKALALAWAKRYGAATLVTAVLLLLAYRYLPRLGKWMRALARVRQVQRGAARASDATLLYSRMLTALKRRGFEKPAWLTPVEFAHLLPASDTATLVVAFTAQYNDLRFGGRREAASRMMQLLETLERR
jgi:transglutaminase-like putative cysteine protease